MPELPECPLWDYQQAASYLGVSKSYLEGVVRKEAIPVIKLGRKVRFRREDLDKWLSMLVSDSMPRFATHITDNTPFVPRKALKRKAAPGMNKII